jgi:predicted transcriptional regulator
MLTGVLRCAECGGKYTIISKTSYGCATNVNGGDSACPNRKRVSRARIEEQIVRLLREDVLAPATVDSVLRKTRQLLTAKRDGQSATHKAQAERRASAEAKVAALVEAIASGGLRGSPALAAALQKAEAELAACVPSAPPGNVVELLPGMERAFRKMVADLPRVLAKDAARSRELLARIFGEIRLARTQDGGLVARLEFSPAQLLELAEGGNCGNGSGGPIWQLLAALPRRIGRQPKLRITG